MAGSVERFERLLSEQGLADRVVRLEEDTRTAELAARALGTEVGAIVKSLVVLVDGRPCLALVSGDRRADLGRVARLFGGERAEMARGARVKEITGFAIGGVPPLLSDEQGGRLPAVIDRGLFRYGRVWAAAGSPYAVFPIEPDELARLASAAPEDFAEPSGGG
jgi:prolyl-tRNA editing enzyme YbaK/EbsC (Cys-tRNA(Pro) deacylase)